jgi:hypothetical protein
MAQTRGKSTAKGLLKRASQLVSGLQSTGKDSGDLYSRLSSANDEFAAGRYSEAELLAEEVVVIANALRHSKALVQAESKRAEPSPKLLRAVGVNTRQALEKFLAGRGLESHISKVARGVAQSAIERERGRIERAIAKISKLQSAAACCDLQKQLDIDGRLAQMVAGKQLGERIAQAISETTAGLTDQEQVKVLSGQIVREVLYGKELANLMGQAVSQEMAQNPPPNREDIEALALERIGRELGDSDLSHAVRRTALGVTEQVINERGLINREESQAAASEVAGEIFSRLFDSEGVRSRIEQLSREVATEVSEALPLLSREEATEIARKESALKFGQELDLVLGQQLSSEEFEARVRFLAEEVTGEVLDEHIGQAQIEREGSSDFSARVREIAAEADNGVVGSQALDQRIQEVVGGVLRKNPPPTRDEIEACALQRLCSELGGSSVLEGVRNAAGSVVESVLGASDFVTTIGVREIASQKFESVLGDLRERILDEDSIRQIAAGVSQEKIVTALSALPDEARLRELASEVVAGKIVEAIGGLPDEDRLKALAEEAIAQKAAELGKSIPGEDSIRKLATEIATEKLVVLAKKLRAEIPEESGIRDLAADVADEKIRAAIGDLPGEGRIGEIAAAAAAEKVAALVGKLPDEKKVSQLATAVAEEMLSKALQVLPGEDRFRELAEQAASAKVAEVAASIPGDKQIIDIVAKVSTEKISKVLRNLPDEKRVRALAGEISDLKTSQALSRQLDSKEFVARVDKIGSQAAKQVITGDLDKALKKLLGGDDFVARVRKLTVATFEDKLSEAKRVLSQTDTNGKRIVELTTKVVSGKVSLQALTDKLEKRLKELGVVQGQLSKKVGGLSKSGNVPQASITDQLGTALKAYTKSEDLAARIAELIGSASEVPAATGGLSKDLEERLSKLEDGLEVLPSYLQGTAQIYQRLNGLEKDLERMPGAEHLEDEISDLRKQLALSAKKLADMSPPETVRDLAESALAESHEHLNRLEEEHSDGRGGEEFRKLIHREIGVAGSGSGDGKLDSQAIAKTLSALLDTPEFAQKIKNLLPKAKS